MLEELLSHLRSYGIHNLEFIIVNSKISHSQEKHHELQKRVSFEVFQETEEEEVWRLMEGDKDDMFVYDKCGRLTYFIPFPLSKLNESPLVSSAILATYFRSPCGNICEDVSNGTLTREETMENDNITDNSTYYNQENGTDMTNTSDVASTEAYDGVISNDIMNLVESNSTYNSSPSADYEDYEYINYNETQNDFKEKNLKETESMFSSFFKMLFDFGSEDEQPPDALDGPTLNNSRHLPMNATRYPEENYTTTEATTRVNDSHVHEAPAAGSNHSKSDPCLEADLSVCRSWSKKRLLHAQKCCSQADAAVRDKKSCKNFSKRRCKKIQSLFKCCLKTAMEITDPPPAVVAETTTLSSDVTCCKQEERGKVCRVSTAGTCEDGECKENSPLPNEGAIT